MRIIVIHHNGKTMAYASHQARLLKRIVPDSFDRLYAEGDIWAWREYRAGDGWADGSADAWRLILEVPQTAEIILS